MRSYGPLFALLFCGTLLIAAVGYWPAAGNFFALGDPQPFANEKESLAKAEALFESGNARASLKIVRKYSKQIERNGTFGRRWLDLFIRGSEKVADDSQLVALHRYRPSAFDPHEEAALRVGDALLLTGKEEEYEELRLRWFGRENLPDRWLVLDADKELLAGNRAEAVSLLESRTFEGVADTPRLTRLAFLNLSEDPKAAWDYLAAACKKDPKNGDLRTYRGKLLEMADKQELALNEYIAAASLAPASPSIGDQLAEFYLRRKEVGKAMEVWGGLLKNGDSGPIWLKAYFWSRVLRPASFDWSAQPLPAGELQPLLAYLAHLSPWEFWNKAAYRKVAKGESYLEKEQAVWWLCLLQALKSGREAEAWELLQLDPYGDASWNPDLLLAFKRIIAYRKTKSLAVEGRVGNTHASSGKEGFLQQLNFWGEMMEQDPALSPPGELENLLESKYAYGAALLAAGWDEAALEVQPLGVLPSRLPEWVAPAFAEAIKRNRGSDASAYANSLQR